ncbi:D-aminoacyl-tRNA deacylase [Liberiplasma polymorphum]|uniref:D-aminoacyl-tRNA deacylase n=1 Tax=Liberiplasma polymorphum TaxID=3374570 RepID=UPI003775F3F2
MKVLVQRVKEATCIINQSPFSHIDKGLLLFVSFHTTDEAILIPQMAKKIAHLRIFEDEEGKMNLSLKDLQLQVMSISQFTLEASTKKGHRPSFTDALNPTLATIYYDQFNEALRKEGLFVSTGSFQAHMDISLINDGPVTILLERGMKND